MATEEEEEVAMTILGGGGVGRRPHPGGSSLVRYGTKSLKSSGPGLRKI